MSNWYEWVLFAVGFVGLVVSVIIKNGNYYPWGLLTFCAYLLTCTWITGSWPYRFVAFISGVLDAVVIAGWIWIRIKNRYCITMEEWDDEKERKK